MRNVKYIEWFSPIIMLLFWFWIIFIKIPTFPNIDTFYDCSDNIIRYDNLFIIGIVTLFEYVFVLSVSKPWKFTNCPKRCGRAIGILLLFFMFSVSFPHLFHCSNEYSLGHFLWVSGCIIIVITEILIVSLFFVYIKLISIR